MQGGQEVAAQPVDTALQAKFAPLAKAMTENEQKIVDELKAVQGKPADIGGYYLPDTQKMSTIMRPSPTLNSILDAAAKG